MSETQLVQEIRLACSDAVLFRNNTGKLQDKTGRWVEFGLCVGSADLIGYRRKDAVFVAIEAKMPGKKPTPAQLSFIAAVKAAGGLAGVAYSVNDAKNIIAGL